MAKTQFPAESVEWREVDSSNVVRVGWDRFFNMYVEFRDGGTYVYHDVPRQRVVAASRSNSVGAYIHRRIKPYYTAVKVA
jgi:hypothetical protein